VNASTGPIADVLFVNGTAGDADRGVTVRTRSPITVELQAAPQGPTAGARYWFWLWSKAPASPVDLLVGGQRLGCTVHPTPFAPLLAPQPFRCFHSAFESSESVCGAVPELSVPAAADFAPWSLTRSQGFKRPITLACQGVLEDSGSANGLHLSVTNCVTVSVVP